MAVVKKVLTLVDKDELDALQAKARENGVRAILAQAVDETEIMKRVEAGRKLGFEEGVAKATEEATRKQQEESREAEEQASWQHVNELSSAMLVARGAVLKAERGHKKAEKRWAKARKAHLTLWGDPFRDEGVAGDPF